MSAQRELRSSARSSALWAGVVLAVAVVVGGGWLALSKDSSDTGAEELPALSPSGNETVMFVVFVVGSLLVAYLVIFAVLAGVSWLRRSSSETADSTH
jgi:cytochrome bd-type quinol oxidase subunit 2